MSAPITEANRVQGWARRLAPLAVMIAPLVILPLALPNALNLPQANPNQTLEYAPVPANENQSAPLGGNFAGLGLATGEAGASEPPPQAPQGGRAYNVNSVKECVAGRQTEDPLSPPCVPYYNGNNGGSTYQGVSGNEVRIVVVSTGSNDGCCQGPTSQGEEQYPPSGTLTDLGPGGPPASSSEFFITRMMRLEQKYFNARYQTYNRFVHFWVFYDDDDGTPDSMIRDAQLLYSKIHPFAILQMDGDQGAYMTQWMAQHGVPSFLGSSYGAAGETEADFQKYGGLIWSYTPALEQRARIFSTWFCTEIAKPGVTSFAGSIPNGTKRKYGLLRWDNDSPLSYYQFGLMVKAGLKQQCGIQFGADEFASSGISDCGNNPPAAGSSIPTFLRDGVTTVIAAGISPCDESNTANGLGYTPEWIVAGAGTADQTLRGQEPNQSEYRHVLVESQYVKRGPNSEDPCFAAAKDADPNANAEDVQLWYCSFYPGVQVMFTGIQVAGPNLTPQNVNIGMHAIPAVPSSDPRVPACFYQPGDYTCVKDGQVEWWDASGQDPEAITAKQGCWRMIQGGKRYIAGTWPRGDAWLRRQPGQDPCNAQVTV